MKKPGNDSVQIWICYCMAGKSPCHFFSSSRFLASLATHKKGQGTDFITYGERIGKRIFFLCRSQLLRCNIRL